ncbi:MAG TPA: hypothetical protein VHQ95_26370 [Pyrinomonadaceae bacterium]|nr:hypothetical protein [Pyrinomonadaceae bacterium]
MKSFLVFALLSIGISLACSASKSASSQAPANGNAQTQPTAPPASVSQQEREPCTLKLAGAPTINGLRIGMTPDELLALFPGSKDDPEVRADVSRAPDKLGRSAIVLKPITDEAKARFAGVSQVSLTLLDGRVSTFTVSYNGPAYPHVDQFIEKFVEGKKLPPVDQWEPDASIGHQLKALKCTDFEVRVFAGGAGGSLNYVGVKDLIADQKLKERRAKARAAATPTPQ